METAVVAFAIMSAAAAVIIAIAVLVVLSRDGRRPWTVVRPWATAGFKWLVLGVAGTILFALLGQSVVLPLLVALGGLAAVVVGVYRQWRNRP